MAVDIPDFIAEQRDEALADVQHLFIAFEDFWEKKLWHQLTDTMIEFFEKPESKAQRLPFYQNFILSFADKINQLKLVTLALNAASQCKGMPAVASSWAFTDTLLQTAISACLS